MKQPVRILKMVAVMAAMTFTPLDPLFLGQLTERSNRRKDMAGMKNMSFKVSSRTETNSNKMKQET